MKTSISILTDYPEKQTIIGSVSYSVFSYALLPSLFFWLNIDRTMDYSKLVWFDIVLRGINFVAVLGMFFRYLRDSFWNVQMNTKNVLKHAGIGAGCMVAVWLVCTVAGTLLENTTVLMGSLPIAEGETYGFTLAMLLQKPTFGLPVIVLLAPFTIACLFYATVFAPLAYQKPWLGYVVMAGVLLLPKVANGMAYWNWGEEMVIYLVQLPIHMIACRIYQKTDTIWTPIIALMMANGVACILNLI